MSTNTPAPEDKTTKEPIINKYYFISNTRLLLIQYDQNDQTLSVELSCLGLFSNLVLSLVIPGYSEQSLNTLLTKYDYKDEVSDKAKQLLERFNYYSFINTAKFLFEKDLEVLVRAEMWPNFHYTKTHLAKASHYLPKDGKGNCVVDVDTDLEDISFYQNTLKQERLFTH